MAEFIFPTSRELAVIAQEKLPRLTAERPIFRMFPMRNVDSFMVSWEQKDNYTGLMQIRGLNGQPGRVKAIGGKRYDVLPGVYGEFGVIDEQQLTMRRQWGTFGTPIDISDLVMEKQDQLLGRRLDRIELILWTLVRTGTYSVMHPDSGIVLATDSYTIQSYGPGDGCSDWEDFSNATPLKDLRQIPLKARGKSVSFGAGAEAYMNRTTANWLLSNSNAADLGGKRKEPSVTINDLPTVNAILAANDLPTIVIYDEGYLDENGTFQLFIQDGEVVIFGKRTNGDPIGEFQLTRNVNNIDMAPGPYMKVIDRGATEVPRSIEVHDGFNGGTAIHYPSAICVMDVNGA